VEVLRKALIIDKYRFRVDDYEKQCQRCKLNIKCGIYACTMRIYSPKGGTPQVAVGVVVFAVVAVVVAITFVDSALAWLVVSVRGTMYLVGEAVSARVSRRVRLHT